MLRVWRCEFQPMQLISFGLHCGLPGKLHVGCERYTMKCVRDRLLRDYKVNLRRCFSPAVVPVTTGRVWAYWDVYAVVRAKVWSVIHEGTRRDML